MNYKEDTYGFMPENDESDYYDNDILYLFEDNRNIETFENERQLEFLHKLIDELDEEYYTEAIKLLNGLLH